MSTSAGSKYLLGIGIEQQIPGSQVGAPRPIRVAVAAGAALSSAEGSSGNITAASVIYYSAFVLEGRGETAPSTGSTALTSVSAKQVSLTAIPTYSGSVATCLGRRIYRSTDSGTTKKLVTEIWNNTATTYTDNLTVGDEQLYTTKVARAASATGSNAHQTAANYGLIFQRPDIGTDVARRDVYGKSTEMTGQPGVARGIPMVAVYNHKIAVEARTSSLLPYLASMFGKPTRAQVSGEPTVTYTFPFSDLTADSISLWGEWYEAGDFRPQAFFSMKAGEIDIAATGKKQAQAKVSLMGLHDTECAFGKVKTGVSTYLSVPVVRGPRMDTNRYTDSIFIKVTSAPAVSSGLGSFTIKATLNAAGTSSPSYGSTALTIYYDPTTKKQIMPAQIGNTTSTNQQSAWVELYESTTGAAIGADVGENRKPVSIYFPDDVSLLANNDVFEILALRPITGIYTAANPTGPSDDGSFTGQPIRTALTTRFTPAHVIIKAGASSGAQVILDMQEVGMKLIRGMDAVEGLGPEAANPTDIDVNGQAMIELDFGKRLTTRQFERLMKEDGRLYVTVSLQGAPIITNLVTGATSATSRELLQVIVPQMRIDSESSPLSTDKSIPQKIKFISEQPDDDSVAFGSIALTTSAVGTMDFTNI